MDLPKPIPDFPLVFMGSCLILRGLGGVLLTNTIYSTFSFRLFLVCISLFYILSNSHFVAPFQLFIYVGAINVLILFDVMFINGSKYYKDFNQWKIRNDLNSLVCTSIIVSVITTILDTSSYEII
ncbi:hypothetical protein V6Z11_A12G062400 [Gossypium hirsutum]